MVTISILFLLLQWRQTDFNHIFLNFGPPVIMEPHKVSACVCMCVCVCLCVCVCVCV